LDRLAREHRSTLVVERDREWLSEISDDPAGLLYRMTRARVLYRVARGRYVVAPSGSTSIRQAARPELLTDVRLAIQTPYFVSFLSALVAHRLIDVQSPTLYVAVPASNSLRRSTLELPGRDIRLVSSSGSRWPHPDDIDEVRLAPQSADTFPQARIERALVDALYRPDYGGGFELVASTWARAQRGSDVDWGRVARIGRDYSPDVGRRTAFMLSRLGYEEEAQLALAGRPGRGAKVLLDRSDDYALPQAERVRDPRTGVVVNVPLEYLEAWLEQPI
jgi:predicted transcriptional regulator of viral defense system